MKRTNVAILDKTKILYKTYKKIGKEYKFLSRSWSTLVNDNLEQTRSLDTQINIDLDWYKHTGADINLIKIFVNGNIYREVVL